VRWLFNCCVPIEDDRRAPDVVIAPGGTSLLELDARDTAPVLLDGELRVEGAEPGAWTARLLPLRPPYDALLLRLEDGTPSLGYGDAPSFGWTDPGSGRTLSSVLRGPETNLDAQGRFQLAHEGPGVFWLALRRGEPGSRDVLLLERLELRAGRNEWRAELGLATLSGGGAGFDASARGARTLVHRVVGPGTRLVQRTFQRERDGTFEPVLVGAGAGALYSTREDEVLGWTPDLAAPLAEVELEPGEARELE
jgi:hypothetical protein